MWRQKTSVYQTNNFIVSHKIKTLEIKVAHISFARVACRGLGVKSRAGASYQPTTYVGTQIDTFAHVLAFADNNTFHLNLGSSSGSWVGNPNTNKNSQNIFNKLRRTHGNIFFLGLNVEPSSTGTINK